MHKKIFFSLFSFCTLLVAKEPMYIQGELQGQLGNQMFIIAATYAHARRHDAIAVFPDLKTEIQWNIPTNYKKIFSHLSTELPPCDLITYAEPFFHYQTIPFYGNMKIQGFFQSEKYFHDYKDEIIQLFQPSEEIETTLEEKYGFILNHPKTVAVHLRWGLRDPESIPPHERSNHPLETERHPYVGNRYIQEAMNQFDKDSLFVVFSEDIYATKRVFRKFNKKNVIFIEETPYYVDFYLMSRCKNQIISNSTFSWWAAYLNKNPEKKVIAPICQRWFGPVYACHDTKDILPADWIQLF